EYMLADCMPKAFLTYKAEVETEIPVIALADNSVFIGETKNPEKINQPNDLLYLIYTSGTTGKPKGVMIENRGVVNLRNYFIKSLQVTEKESILQFANIIFDGSVWEMNMALLIGGRLVVANKDERENTEEFVKMASKEKVKIATIPPVFYFNMDEFKPEVVITAGSESNRRIVEKVVRNSKYINAYGPSECTVAATHWECVLNDIIPDRIPIGKPILNTKVYILNQMKLCGIGVPGELCIAGDGLAR
ncbi:AMP-binding protein, partial [Bacillus mycoides]|uniref:AMP-binding protein n=1 Tax=Bacillus mycoides TaxID=1405 RepID=UPI001151BA59